MRMQCAAGLRFDHILGRCEAADTVECFSCPAELIFIDVHVPNECNQFVRCYNGRAEQLTCAQGLRFDVTFGMCNLQHLVKCPFTMECPKSNDNFIIKRDPNNCAT